MQERREKVIEEARLKTEKFQAQEFEKDRRAAQANAEAFFDGLVMVGLGASSDQAAYMSNYEMMLEKQAKNRAAKKLAEQLNGTGWATPVPMLCLMCIIYELAHSVISYALHSLFALLSYIAALFTGHAYRCCVCKSQMQVMHATRRRVNRCYTSSVLTDSMNMSRIATPSIPPSIAPRLHHNQRCEITGVQV